MLVMGIRSRRRQARRLASTRSLEGRTDPAGVPGRSWGELIVDFAWVVGAAGYVYLAHGFPSPAGLAPTYLGVAVLVVAVLQLVGGFSDRFRRFTLGSGASVGGIGSPTDEPSGGRSSAAPAPMPAAMVASKVAVRSVRDGSGSRHESLANLEAAPAAASPFAMVPPASGTSSATDPATAVRSGTATTDITKGDALRQSFCILLAFGLVAGIYLLGFEIAVPLFTLLYFTVLYRCTWWKAVAATVVMAGVAYAAAHLLSVIFPTGILL